MSCLTILASPSLRLNCHFPLDRTGMVKRPQTSQTAEKAVLFVEAILNEVNWVSNRLHQDFGIDLHVKVFEANGRRRGLPWDFFIQVKGTTKLRLSGDTIR